MAQPLRKNRPVRLW